jgi:hypothetical protein
MGGPDEEVMMEVEPAEDALMEVGLTGDVLMELAEAPPAGDVLLEVAEADGPGGGAMTGAHLGSSDPPPPRAGPGPRAAPAAARWARGALPWAVSRPCASGRADGAWAVRWVDRWAGR